LIITLTEAEVGDHFFVKHIEVIGQSGQKLSRLGVEPNKILVLVCTINTEQMTAIQIGEKAIVLQKEETDQIYGEVVL